MACCGQKRAEASRLATSRPETNRPAAQPPNTVRTHAAFAAPPVYDMVEVEYLARSPVLVRGPVTGVTYQFSAAAPIQRVYRGDVNALLSTRHFRAALRMP